MKIIPLRTTRLRSGLKKRYGESSPGTPRTIVVLAHYSVPRIVKPTPRPSKFDLSNTYARHGTGQGRALSENLRVWGKYPTHKEKLCRRNLFLRHYPTKASGARGGLVPPVTRQGCRSGIINPEQFFRVLKQEIT